MGVFTNLNKAIENSEDREDLKETTLGLHGHMSRRRIRMSETLEGQVEVKDIELEELRIDMKELIELDRSLKSLISRL